MNGFTECYIWGFFFFFLIEVSVLIKQIISNKLILNNYTNICINIYTWLPAFLELYRLKII